MTYATYAIRIYVLRAFYCKPGVVLHAMVGREEVASGWGESLFWSRNLGI